MVKKSLFLMVVGGLILGGCSDSKNEDVKTADSEEKGGSEEVYRNDYNYVFSADPDTFDYVYSYQGVDLVHTTNFVDALLEHDQYGNLVGALAESYEKNDDATKFTFNIRQGVPWVTDEGEEYAEVTAQDFVTGLRHAVEFDSQTLYLVQYVIKNLNAYYNGEVEWEEVGIKAIDDYTLEYELETTTPYFDTMAVFSVLQPINQEFLESKGDGCKLGSPDSSNCKFGEVSADGILYNGAFLLSNYTSKSVIEYVPNESYWDAEHVYIPHVKLVYYNGSDPDSLFKAFDNGELSLAPVYTDNAAVYKTAKDNYGEDIYIGNTTSATFWMSWVFDRNAYNSPLDETVDVSPQTDKQRADTALAKLNTAFRKAVFYATDGATVNAQSVGEDLKYNRLRNLLTQPDFVLTSDGRLYSDLVSEALTEINEVEYPSGFDLSDGQMAYFSADLATQYANQAKEELLEEGVEFPIQLDIPVNGELDQGLKVAQAYKNSLEQALPGFIQVNLLITDSVNLSAAKTADQMNADLTIGAGWAPDYGDPKSNLDILDPDEGDCLKGIGLNWTGSEVGNDAMVKEAIGLYEFKALKETAEAIVDDNDERYTAYAKAEAYLIDNALIIPYTTRGGNYVISKVVPYSGLYSAYGPACDKYKYVQVSDEIVSLEEREALEAQWRANLGN